MDAQLKQLAGIDDQRKKIEVYKALLPPLFKDVNLGELQTVVEHLVGLDEIVVSRQVLSDFVKAATALPKDKFIELAQDTLRLMQPKVLRFEEQVTALRERLAEHFEADERWSEAAKTLSGIPLDAARDHDKEYKVRPNIKIAQLYLEDDESVSAETFLNRAAELLHQVKDDSLKIKYKGCMARIQDHKRDFISAAAKYYELSQVLGESERLEALKLAVTCAVLAPAGPLRSRMLATLFKDERSSKLDIFSMLEKMYLERVIRKSELDAFVEELAPHQMATLSDGSKVHERAVIEHNLLACSRIYRNIAFAELGTLLGIEPIKAEKIAAKMITEDRLKGSIDQTSGLLVFSGGGGHDVHQTWDSHIAQVCGMANACADSIAKKYPQLIQ